MDFLSDLNPAQKQAVQYNDGPLMVIAGAGSGKTRVLTYKIAYLIQNGWEPHTILALTFTNKAADEMKERIAHLVNPQHSKRVWAGTFHSIFAKILRREANYLNYSPNFSIYDTTDSKNTITDVLKRMNLHNHNNYKPEILLSKISALKNKLISPVAYSSMHSELAKDKEMGREYFIDIYKAYQQQLYRNSAMDFDDLLYYTYTLFHNFPEVLHKYESLFQYILVDEFQDTNSAQYSIVRLLSKTHQKICVVGDDAQSIYSFRGADINNIIVHFKTDFPSHRLIKLEENYRSTKHIIAASNAVIENNQNQIRKQIYTNNQQGDPIYVYECIDDKHEAELVAREIYSLKKNWNVSYSDISILYRTNAQSRAFEDTFRRYQIPYKIWGGMSFYQRKEIKEILSYFRVIINPNDTDALLRIINVPTRGIGDTTIDKLKNYAYDNETSIFNILKSIRSIQNELNISTRQVETIEHFISNIEKYQQLMPQIDVGVLAEEIVKFSSIISYYEAMQTEDSKDRVLNIKELLNAIQQFAKTPRTLPEEEALNNNVPVHRTLDEFLREVSLLTSQDDKNASDNTPKVTLMTVHLSKGLEFPYVFITGLEEQLFPSSRATFNRKDIEEERRLFYVALTRAKQRVHLCYAQRRFINGKYMNSIPSRFIDEIPPNCLELKLSSKPKLQPTQQFKVSVDPYPSNTNNANAKKLIPITTAQKEVNDYDHVINQSLQIGDKVFHNKFEKGIIIDISGRWPDSKAVVDFEKYGTKTLLLKFATLKKI